jgi:hypothetical protein
MFQDITDARGVTNSQGQALLQVSTGEAQQRDLRIEVSGGWARALTTVMVTLCWGADFCASEGIGKLAAAARQTNADMRFLVTTVSATAERRD